MHEPLRPEGEGVMRGPLSRLRERVGVRVFTRRMNTVSFDLTLTAAAPALKSHRLRLTFKEMWLRHFP